MACHLSGTKASYEPMLAYFYLDPWEQISANLYCNLNATVFIHENWFDSVICEMTTICLGLNVLAHSSQIMATTLRTMTARAGTKSHEFSLQWRHNGLDSASNHQPHHCLFSRWLGRRSKKTSKLRVTGLCAGNSWPVTRKMFSFDDVIMDRS